MKKYVLPLFVILLFTIVTWHMIIRQSFMGEGYFYFFYRLDYTSAEKLFRSIILSYDAGAKLLFELLRVAFKDTIVLYQWFLLSCVVLINILFYIVTYQLTQRKAVALVASILLSVSFTGFEMFALGNYQFFSQRAFYLLLLLPSFLFYLKFLHIRRFRWYICSFVFYAVAITLAHFSFFFFLFFALYVFAFTLVSRLSPRQRFVGLIIFLPFVAVTYFYMNIDTHQYDPSFTTQNTLLRFLSLRWSGSLNTILHQLTILTVPEHLITYLSSRFVTSHHMVSRWFYVPVSVMYSAAGLYLWKREKRLRVMTLTCLLYFPVVFFFNYYIRIEMVERLGSGSRYLYLPSLAFSIFWAMFGVSLWSSSKRLVRATCIACFLFWVIVNIRSVWLYIDRDFYQHKASKTSLGYLRSIATTLKDDSIVIVPAILGYYGARFSQMYYGKKNTTFEHFFSNWANELPRQFDPKKDIILEYDYKEQVVRDRSNEYVDVISQRTTPARK